MDMKKENMPSDIRLFITADPELLLDYCFIGTENRIDYVCDHFLANPTLISIPFISETPRSYTVSVSITTPKHTGTFSRITKLSKLRALQSKVNQYHIQLRLEANRVGQSDYCPLTWNFPPPPEEPFVPLVSWKHIEEY